MSVDERGYDEGGFVNEKEWTPEKPDYPVSFARNVDGARWHVWAKWDGCIHVHIREDKEVVYLHICDLDGVIQALLDLRRVAGAAHRADRPEWAEFWPERER
jgi:hypothetical protein